MVYIYFSLDITSRLQTRFSCIKVLPEHKFRRYSANRPSQWNFWRKYFDRVVAQSWFLQFWRSDECPKGITMISGVQGSWERISFFKVRGERTWFLKKSKKWRSFFCTFQTPFGGRIPHLQCLSEFFHHFSRFRGTHLLKVHFCFQILQQCWFWQILPFVEGTNLI